MHDGSRPLRIAEQLARLARRLESRLRGGLAVSDDEVRRAIAFAARTLKLVVYPGGAVALACVLGGKVDTRERTVAVTLSGGNVDDSLLAAILGTP